MRSVMSRVAVVSLLLTATASAQPPPPQSPPQAAPTRLLAAQQLALVAYPELRTEGLQLRVDGAGESRITLGFASHDREDILGLSRPREAQLVVEATFDQQDALTSAVMRGRLAKVAERRRLRASLPTIASSHGRNGAPARKRGSARQAFTNASCAASSASAAEPANRQAVRKAMSWCARTSAS